MHLMDWNASRVQVAASVREPGRRRSDIAEALGASMVSSTRTLDAFPAAREAGAA